MPTSKKTESKTASQSAVTLEAWSSEEAQAAGFFGRVPDPTPNANYSASSGDAPTPETAEGLKQAAQERMRELAS